MHQKYEYPQQFEPADLSEGYEYVNWCIRHGIEIDFYNLPPELIGDLLTIKIKEFSKHDISD